MAQQQTLNYQLPYYQGPDPADGAAQQQALAEKVDQVLKPIDDRALGAVPIGSVMMWLTAAAPTRWLICDGASYATSAYPLLSSVLGENPVGSGNFVVPDLKARLPIGAGALPSGASLPVRQQGGAEKVALSTAELPSHDHGGKTGLRDRSQSHGHAIRPAFQSGPVNGSPSVAAYFDWGIMANVGFNGTNSSRSYAVAGGDVYPSDVADHLHYVNAQGGGQTHDNMPPYLVVNFIVRAN